MRFKKTTFESFWASFATDIFLRWLNVAQKENLGLKSGNLGNFWGTFA